MRKPALSLSYPVRSFLPFFVCILTLLTASKAKGQVKIGDNPNTINSNSALEIESTNKGFLPPRMAINSLTAVTPLTGTVPAGMLVYSSGGSVPDGYYFWNGTVWASVGGSNMITKSVSASITKLETFVLASNDITLTLPVITAADNGLTISIKNIGTHTDLVTVKGAGTTTIDAMNTVALTRWVGKSFVAYGGNWVTKEKETALQSVLEVSPTSSWTTIDEALEFLDEHMTGPSVIKLGPGTFEIDGTQTISLGEPLTVQGTAYGKTIITPASGHTGPLFKAVSETYFKMLSFDAGNATFGNTGGNDAIQFEGAEYFEVKDCSFDGFNKAMAVETNAELWVFEVDVENAIAAGIEVAAGATTGVTLKVSEVDFTNCVKGVNLVSGADATVSILNSTFYNTTGDIGINYVPGTGNFTNFISMFITNNAWNNVGSFFAGFDFSRADGRDSKAFIQNNAGEPDRKPSCFINTLNNTTTSTLSSSNTWYTVKMNTANTTTTTTSWTITNTSNVYRIAYQPVNKRSGYFIISGNISCTSSNRTLSIAVFRNGDPAQKFGEITIRTGASGTPSVFSTIVYLSEISNGNFFELGVSSTNSGDVVTLQDVQWLAETK